MARSGDEPRVSRGQPLVHRQAGSRRLLLNNALPRGGRFLGLNTCAMITLTHLNYQRLSWEKQ